MRLIGGLRSENGALLYRVIADFAQEPLQLRGGCLELGMPEGFQLFGAEGDRVDDATLAGVSEGDSLRFQGQPHFAESAAEDRIAEGAGDAVVAHEILLPGRRGH